jgi:hypothetical protein
MSHPLRSPRLLTIALLAVGAVLCLAAARARAADTVYWANYTTGSIGHASLAGGDGGMLDTGGAEPRR